MLKKLLAFLLVVVVLISSMSTVIIGVAAATDAKQTLNVSVVTTKTNNDLLTTLQANYNGIEHYTSLDTALANAEEGEGIMVLADNYPNSTTTITQTQAAKINELGVRLYVEFPTNNETLGITGFGSASSVGSMYYDRAVVVDAAAVGMAEYSLLYVHGAKYLKKEDTTNSWLVNAKVAGYDVADFGLEGCVAETDTSLWIARQNHVPYSMLETNASGNVLICSTKFSQFITARYAPYARWQQLWLSILSWVAQSEVTSIEWTPSVNANYGKTDTLSADAYTTAVDLNAQWYINNMLPAADGSAGVYQCYNSGYAFNAYGEQSLNAGVRADCTGESIGALAIAGVVLDNEEYKDIAYNAMDWMLNEANMANLDRADPTSPHYGLLSWYDDNDGTNSYYTTYLKSYYGDDNAKAILGLILGAAALETDEFDERILEAILANFRTTGKNGFRGNHIGSELDTNGWEYYFNRTNTNYASHFESLLWACYLWAYEKTGYEPLLERTKTAISMMMTAYDHTMNDGDVDASGEWNWTNGLQADRAKLIWPLAWLVRVEPTEEHIGWLDTMITDMMAYQDAETGALRDVIGDETQGKGSCGSFTNNVDYGRYESPVIQNNGDPCSDSLYAASFAMVALNEAYAAMASINADTAAKYQQYAKSLSDYHVRIQQVSDNTKYNGVWFRGFDYEKWETYGSDGDAGWGIWVTETGWSQAQISSALSLQTLGTNIWDYSKDSTVNAYFADTAETMLGDYYTEPEANATADVTFRNSADPNILIDGIKATDPSKWNTQTLFAGYEGSDITVTIDYGQNKTFDSVTVGFSQYISIGACYAKGIKVLVSDDNANYKEVAYHSTGVDVQQVFETWYNNGSKNGPQEMVRITAPLDKAATARYVKIVIENPGTYNNRNAGISSCKTWMFMDEIEVSLTTYSMEELKALIDTAQATSVDGKQPATVLALDEALQAALEHYNSNSTNTLERKKVYNALKNAIDGLKNSTNPTLVSPSSSLVGWANINNLLDGKHNAVAAGWKVLDLSTGKTIDDVEIILDMQETVGVMSVGYSAQSRPNSGIYMQNAKYYVSDSVDGDWTYVGEVKGTADLDGNYSDANEYQTLTALANGAEGRYVKVVFSYCGDHEVTVNGSLKKSEWAYLSEILINEFVPVNLETQNATVEILDNDGNKIGILGAMYGKDITVNITTDEAAIPVAVTVNGNDITVNNNSFVIENVTEEQNIVVKYNVFAAEDFPTITGVKDLFVAVSDVASFDPRVDIAAYDKDGNDITSQVTYSGNISAAVGTYTVTYNVVASNGASAQATANVYVVDSLNAKHVVAVTPSTTAIDSWRNQMNKAQILLDGIYAPSNAAHSDSRYLPWKNTDNIEIVIALDGKTKVSEIGYSLAAAPQYGFIAPDVDFYVTDQIGIGTATKWTHAGTIEAVLHPHENLASYDYIKKTISIDEMTSGYIKVVIRFDDNQEILDAYKGTPGKGIPEWTFVDEIILKGHTHTLTAHSKVAATCKDTGMMAHWSCACGKLFSDANGTTEIAEADLVIAKDSTNHTGGTEIKNAKTETCGDAGYTGDTYCKGCGAKTADGQTIAATGNHSGGTATCQDKAVCITCGQPYGEKNTANHTGGTEIKNAKTETCGDAGYTGDTYCKGCGAKTQDGQTIAATGNHSGGTATCKDKAVCITCGQPYGEKNSTNHTGGTEIRGRVEAAEFEEGYTGDTYCKGCNTKLSNGTVIPASHVHTLTAHAKVEATCETAGTIEYWSCSCELLFADQNGTTEISKDDLVIKATGHTLTHHEKVDASTEAEGTKEHWSCTCGKLFLDKDAKTETTAQELVIAKLEAAEGDKDTTDEDKNDNDTPTGDNATTDNNSATDNNTSNDANTSTDKGEQSPQTSDSFAVAVVVTALIGAAFVILRKARKA